MRSILKAVVAIAFAAFAFTHSSAVLSASEGCSGPQYLQDGVTCYETWDCAWDTGYYYSQASQVWQILRHKLLVV